MRSRLAGLWHVRGGPAAATVVLVALVLTVVFPEMIISVSVAFQLPARGVGTPEIVGFTVASVLPALTVPEFDAREMLAARGARVAHVCVSLVVIALPLTVVPSWAVRIQALQPLAELPSTSGLMLNVLFFSAMAATACLFIGRALSVLLTMMAIVGLVLGQHLLPDSPLTSLFATGRVWQASWWPAASLVAVAGMTAWITRGVPLTARTS